MGPFDVTPKDIGLLNDDQLRDLLRQLVEAEVRQHGIPRSGIRLGGDQNARDCGIDARVEWTGDPLKTEWFPRRLVIFQSKAEAMPQSKINSEMAPKGRPRDFFRELIRKSGSYIIFSTVDCSEKMYRERISAMKVAIAKLRSSKKVALDFCDASKIARWANCYPGVANYARNIVGRPLAGWRPYESWSSPTISVDQEYLVDDIPKVILGTGSASTSSIKDAMAHVRDRLQAGSPGRSPSWGLRSWQDAFCPSTFR